MGRVIFDTGEWELCNQLGCWGTSDTDRVQSGVLWWRRRGSRPPQSLHQLGKQVFYLRTVSKSEWMRKLPYNTAAEIHNKENISHWVLIPGSIPNKLTKFSKITMIINGKIVLLKWPSKPQTLLHCLKQGRPFLLLKGKHPAEFSSSSNTLVWKFLVNLKTLISWFRCV